MTPSNTLLRIGFENGYCKGGERSVHKDGMGDSASTGVLRGKRKKREDLRSEGIGWETFKKILVHQEPLGIV
jgi:hypothetical protein